MPTLRTIKRAHDARATRWLKALAAYMREMAGPTTWPDDGDWDYDEDLGCTHCGGEGFAEVDDPLWDECDEFGWGPCTSCHGTGRRDRQWVF